MKPHITHYANRAWVRWKKGLNTAEIARAMDMPEHEIDRVISQVLDAKYTGQLMPWNKV